MFFTSDAVVDFSVIPKQPFYVLDIAFTESWMCDQFNDAALNARSLIDQNLREDINPVLIESTNTGEYKVLRELETFMNSDKQDVLFIRSRIYNLIVIFFRKLHEDLFDNQAL